MAKPVNDDELQLKKRARRRLVGAVVLVLLVVVFLPMVLDNERKPLSGNVVIQIPPVEPADRAFPSSPGGTVPQEPAAAVSASPVAPADPAGPAATDPGPAGAIAPEPAARAEASAAPKPEPEPVAKPDPVARPEPKTEPKPAPKAEPKQAPKAEPKQASKTEAKLAARPEAKPAPADASPSGFVVQLGAFSDPGNARTLLGRLKQAQIPAYAEAVKTSNGTRTRVRAGPYSSEAAAEKGRDRVLALKIATGDLKVVRQGD